MTRKPGAFDRFMGRAGMAGAIYAHLAIGYMLLDALSWTGGRPLVFPCAAMFLVFSTLIGVALASRAKEKGRAWQWGLLGIGGFVGWLVVKSLPTRELSRGFEPVPLRRHDWREFIGSIDSGDPSAGDNDRIDQDLAREYSAEDRAE